MGKQHNTPSHNATAGDSRSPWLERIGSFLAGAVLTGAGFLWSINARMSAIETTAGNLQSGLSDLKGMPADFARLDEKVNTISRDVDALRNLQQGRIASRYKRAAFTVVDANASPRAYQWKFKQPIDPATVSSMMVQPLLLPDGVDVTSTITDDGTGCMMTIDGPDDVLRTLPAKIPADVTVSTRS